ncbi:hypothetical protein SDC9_40581 [bioreactor metagenome]|uniref:DUF4348 domain-containing protein n=1 Tax=bioreactor metagenome TaxID=1076179 RepID=A0A644VST7_9ZZZZ
MILLFSCSSRTNSKKVDSEPIDQEAIVEHIIESDLDFNDFILHFGFNPDFQKSRIKFPLKYVDLKTESLIKEDAWINDHLYSGLEAITDISNGRKVNKESNERVFSWIKTESKISKNYYFKMENEQWFLLKIEIKQDSVDQNNEDFISFLGEFCKDSIFQTQRINFPLDMTFLDNDYNEVKENWNQEQWKFSRFYYDCDSIAILYYDSHRNFKDTDYRILIINGVENGINAQFTFERIEGKWFMTKYEDYST